MSESTIATTIFSETLLSNVTEINGIKFLSIPLEMLEVHPQVQRPVQSHVHKIAMAYDPRKAKAIVVSYRDGHFYIIDGQHRYLAAKEAGQTHIACQVYEKLTLRDEALLFGNQDENVKKLTLREKIKAFLLAGVPMAVELKRVCDDYNVGLVDLKEHEPVLTSIADALTILNRCGEPALRWIFDVIKLSGWSYEHNGFSSNTLAPLRNVYISHLGELSETKRALVRLLSHLTPDLVVAKAMSEYVGKGRTVAVTQLLEGGIAHVQKAIES